MAANSPIRAGDDFFIGEDKSLRWAVEDDDEQPLPITGWTIEFRLYPYKGATSPLFTKSVSVLDGSGGICGVTIARGDTIALAAGRRWYTVWRTNSGSYTEIAYGFAELKAP